MTRVALLAIALCLVGSAAAAQAGRTLDAGVWFLRVTNPAKSGGKLCARVYFNPNLDPWYGDTLYVARGAEKAAAPPAAEWLEPGQSSEWVDIGRHMSRKPTFTGSRDYLAPVFVGAMTEPAQTGLALQVEIAAGPDKRIVRRIAVADPLPTRIGYQTWLGSGPKLPTLGLLIPASPASKERIWTLEEAAQQQLDWIASYGPTPKPASHVWFISHQSAVSLKNPSRLERMQAEIVRRLGYGSLVNYAGDRDDLHAIEALGAQPLPTRLVHAGDDLAAQAAELKKNGLWDYVRLVSFGDEIDISLRATPDQQNAAFVADLKARGFHPADFIRPEDEAKAAGLAEDAQWRLVRLQGALPAAKPKLLYEAAVFRYRLWTREMAERTKQVQALYPAGVQTGANYSPHLSVWPDVRKWVDMFRDGGMTMPWSEDWWWQVPEASPQSYGYLLDALRHAADYRGAPMCFYTIPDNGETADHLLRMNYFALAHQAKVVDHFAIYHQAFGTCDWVDFLESRGKFRSIHRILTDVGQIDERLAQARVRPADVAILMPLANDVWNTEDLLTDPKQDKVHSLYYAQLNVDNHERKAVWLALRHAHLPVDLITDEDVAAGKLARYKVLYLVGQELLQEAVEPLRRWVEAGGTLVASGGGGPLNQYREPMPAMRELFGIAASDLQRPVRTIGPAEDLPKLKPLDTARAGSTELPALCYKQAITPGAGASPIAKYADGTAAAVERRVGKGRALLYGVLPGLAYLRPAMEQKHGMPEAFPEALRKLIVAPAEAAGARRQVTTSDPLIEATLQEGPLGAVVTLTSFRNQPVARVTVTFPGLPDARRVRSLRRGPCRVTVANGVPTVTLPVDQGDFLVVDR